MSFPRRLPSAGRKIDYAYRWTEPRTNKLGWKISILWPICANTSDEGWALLLPRSISHSPEICLSGPDWLVAPWLTQLVCFLWNDRFWRNIRFWRGWWISGLVEKVWAHKRQVIVVIVELFSTETLDQEQPCRYGGDDPRRWFVNMENAKSGEIIVMNFSLSMFVLIPLFYLSDFSLAWKSWTLSEKIPTRDLRMHCLQELESWWMMRRMTGNEIIFI